MPRPLRLLFAIKAMNNPGGGAERVLADLTAGFARRGHDVSILTFESPGGQSFYPLGEAVQRIDLGIGSTTGRATVGTTTMRLLSLRRHLAKKRPDIAIGFMHSMYIPLAMALLGSGVPVIASEHNVPERYWARPLEQQLIRATPLFLDRIVCVTEQAKNQYPLRLQQIMDVIPNPIGMSASRRATVVREDTRTNTLLAVGRLAAQKDHDTLIRAFAMIAMDFPDWKLRIVGEGELRNTLAALVGSLSLEGRVEMPGGISDISREYEAAQLFVMPSRYESLGLATVEALAHGLPAVGFADCPGTNELIRNDVNGLLVNPAPNRTAALAHALKGLMVDPSTRLRLAAAANATTDYSMDSVLDKWEDLFGRILQT